MKPLEIKTLNHWNEFVKIIGSENYNQEKYIYRGQSNDFGSTWQIQSSFSRLFNAKGIRFSDYISQRYDSGLFEYLYNQYKINNIKELLKASLLEKLYYFQHYGIPTCLIDFTKDPLIALYFSICGIIIPSIRSYSSGKSNVFSDCQYFSVFQLNYKNLIEFYQISEITENNIEINEFSDYFEQFDKSLHNIAHYKIYLDINPRSEIDNYNLDKQKGCFLLFDNTDNGVYQFSFEDFLNQFYNLSRDLNEPILVRYDIPYNSIYAAWSNHLEEDESLFKYLQGKEITGKNLFDDLQAIRYDSNLYFID